MILWITTMVAGLLQEWPELELIQGRAEVSLPRPMGDESEWNLSYHADFEGTFFVWVTATEGDPRLKLQHGAIRQEDENSGGGLVPFLFLDVLPKTPTERPGMHDVLRELASTANAIDEARRAYVASRS